MNASIPSPSFFDVATQAAGQIIAARHFDVGAMAKVNRSENGTYVAQTFFHQTTKFRKAVIAWAGICAQKFVECRYADDDPEAKKPCAEMVLCEAMLSDWESFSVTDQTAIYGHPQRLRAARLAATIVHDNSSAISSELDYIMQGVVTPEVVR